MPLGSSAVDQSVPKNLVPYYYKYFDISNLILNIGSHYAYFAKWGDHMLALVALCIYYLQNESNYLGDDYIGRRICIGLGLLCVRSAH
jgi:hypothetical protein